MAFIKRPDQQQIKEHLAEYLLKTEMHSERDDHKTIETWFSRLRLFYGMPFNYIVPDERMLPTESLRFFQVDNNWMDVLIDGAFSIGSSKPMSSNSQLAAHIAAFRESAKQKMSSIRATILSKATGPAAEKAKKYLEEYRTSESNNLSGFFLRSMVITGWPGIQVHGFSDAAAQNSIRILRMEKLSSSLLFVIFEGVVQSVIFEEPSEGVHFGVTPDTIPPTTELRYAQTGDGVTSGTVITGEENYPVPMRGTSTLNVLRANTFAQQLINQPTVWPPNTPPPYPAFTAAQFALELVQGVQSVQFTCSATPKNNPA
ncbi:hypothetical protein HDF18_08050 [Mucilaginibacter sp. X5P1]|uniref:hypothetical protein n=1 Tax=Mucilaginibacter sp. X5P1 TaxID=2723088 RepID=UPI00161BA1BA|nr:hypothetical protein [Mucilaginibacter sp. X5P1]MBB6137605.1 hypothetical protein [Mucilaginibacter sp. X5P1]